MTITARESMNKELDNALESIGFAFKRKHDEIYTTAANLLMWTARYGITKIDAMSLIQKLLEDHGVNIGNWAEDQYEYQDYDNFDDTSFNNYVERQLDSIIEKLEEDVNVTEFLEFRKKILSKYKIDVWYELPKDIKKSFKIKGFDRDDMTVSVEMRTPEGRFETKKYPEENFYNLLHQPELF
jgi:hypothetical protein